MKPEKIAEIVNATFVTMYYVDDAYHESHPMLNHKHKEFSEIIYVAEGKGSYKVDSRIYELTKGDIIIVDKNTIHGEEPFLREQIITITLAIKDLTVGNKKIESLLGKNKRAVIQDPENEAIGKLFFTLYQLQDKKGYDITLADDLSSLIVSMVYDRIKTERKSEERSSLKRDEIISQIVEYIDEHYTEEITLNSLADKFGLSNFHLAHLFKKETGIPPMKYIMHIKIGEVQNLLMNTDESIGDIGERVGFANSCHLSSVFKKYFGISPKEYRNHFRGKENV